MSSCLLDREEGDFEAWRLHPARTLARGSRMEQGDVKCLLQ